LVEVYKRELHLHLSETREKSGQKQLAAQLGLVWEQ